jgi:hypothetical protein
MKKAITIEKVDEVTGKTITFTLPCGSPLPAGAVCVLQFVWEDLCAVVMLTQPVAATVIQHAAVSGIP